MGKEYRLLKDKKNTASAIIKTYLMPYFYYIYRIKHKGADISEDDLLNLILEQYKEASK